MSKKTYFHRVQEQTPTRFWINNVSREEANLAIEAGAVGCTQNPSYTWKMMSNPEEKSHVIEILDNILQNEKDDNEALIKLQRELVKEIALIFAPIYTDSCGKNGYVSIQGDPFREDLDNILRIAYFNRQAAPNIMVKIPVTKVGLEAIKILAAERIPINATEVMAVKQALDVAEVYEKATAGMRDPAPLYISHITGIYDEYLKEKVRSQNIDIPDDIVWQAGVSIAKKLYWMIRDHGSSVGLIGGGARGLHHFTEMVGSAYCVTVNWSGTADRLIEQDPPVVERFLQPTPDYVTDELLEKVEDYRKCYLVNAVKPEEYEDLGPVVYFRNSFERAWEKATKVIKQRRAELYK